MKSSRDGEKWETGKSLKASSSCGSGNAVDWPARWPAAAIRASIPVISGFCAMARAIAAESGAAQSASCAREGAGNENDEQCKAKRAHRKIPLFGPGLSPVRSTSEIG